MNNILTHTHVSISMQHSVYYNAILEISHLRSIIFGDEMNWASHEIFYYFFAITEEFLAFDCRTCSLNLNNETLVISSNFC